MAECANPLLLGFVKGWLDQAEERNSKGASVYRKAYKSLKACPIRFDHPAEAQQLHGFGSKLCDRLTAKLKEYCESEGVPMPQVPSRKRKKAASKDNEDDDVDEPSPPKKARKQKAYVPCLRTGPYALVLAMATLDEDSSSGLTKQELIELAQPYCESSFTAPSQTNKFYTAWNSMKTLESKDLVYVRGRPTKRYQLTDEGWEVARRIKKTLEPGDLAGVSKDKNKEMARKDRKREILSIDLSPSPPRSRPQAAESSKKAAAPDLISQGTSSALPTFTPIILPPGTFSVELVLDVREKRSTSDRDYVQIELAKKGSKPIVRSLGLGDILWVAKLHDPNLLSSHGAEGDEVMLDWIVERKRLDDLVGSIKDGRFHEQKFRARKSGIKNVIYLIEEFAGNAEHFHKYEESVESAIASTQVVSGFFVKKTQKMDDSIRYLARMTMMLKERYENKHLRVIPTSVITRRNYLPLLNHLREREPGTDYHITSDAFDSLVSKSDNLTLRDVFLKMLMCIRGVTGEKALEIQRRWKTPAEFVEAYQACGSGDQGRKKRLELVSAQMGGLVGRRKISKVLSVKIAEVWGDEEYA